MRYQEVALRALLIALFLALAAGPLSAQEHLNVARGFGRYAQQGLGIDTVNSFNGNLTLAIPLGPTYPVGPELSFQLMLLYNSQVWELQNLGSGVFAYPSRTDNAGVGWRVSLGQLVAPNSSGDVDNTQWVYIGADGARHHFYNTLHAGEQPAPNFFYTRDGSYLRLNATLRKVAFPNGIEHIFDANGRLHRMEDPHGHYVEINYSTDAAGDVTEWQISDSHNRHHYVRYQSSGSSFPRWVVKEVELEAVATATHSKYTFSFENQFQVPCSGQGTALWLPFLTGISQPDQTSFAMPLSDYYLEPPPANPATTACRSGRLARLTLPTGGKLEWDYRVYTFPAASTSRLPWRRSTGVARRSLVSPGPPPTQGPTWLYNTSLAYLDTELLNTVTEPSGTQTRKYFGVATQVSPPDERSYEYGLPLTRRVGDGTGTRYLSREIVAGSTTRTFYLRYDHDAGTVDPNDPEEAQRLNQRQAGSRWSFEDGSVSDDSLTNFDGHGHYRSRTYGGTFPGENNRVEAIGWAAGNGLSPGQPGYAELPTNSRWVLDNYSFTWTKQGSAPLRFRSYCFDANGYLLGKRIHGSANNTADATASDLVEVYVPSFAAGSQGFVADEYFLGGDDQPLPFDPNGGFVCTLAQTPSFYANAQYRIHHTYSAGVPSSHTYYNAGGASVLQYMNQTIDFRTGLPTASSDPAGLSTSYTYDEGWRLKTVTPQSDATTSMTYTSTTATLERLQGPNSLLRLESSVDLWGRPYNEKRKIAAGTFSETRIFYDDQGRQNYVSVPGTPGSGTTIRTFDGFGRPTSVRPPDGASHDISISYAGIKTITRTTQVFQPLPSGCTTNCVPGEGNAVTIETYDRFGRLYQVQEPNGTRTRYDYDVDSKLVRVCHNAAGTPLSETCGQQRTFTYDTRGLLLSETHPEKTVATTYGSYDARGHAKHRVEGTSDLTFAIDRAERLTAITEPTMTGPRTLKSFDYATSNGNYFDPLTGTNCFQYSKGKLAQQSRFNYGQVFGGNFTAELREGFTYCGPRGRLSRRQLDSRVNGATDPSESFVWPSFGYDGLGQITSLDYPRCFQADCTSPTPRTVTNTYDNGLLKAVGTPTNSNYYASSIAYHPSLAVSQVVHNNNPADASKSLTDTYAADPNGIPRPASISVTGTAGTRWATGSYSFDGVGNVKAIGTHSFVYDNVSRLLSSSIYLEPTSSSTLRTQSFQYDVYGNINNISGSSGLTTTTSSTTNRLLLPGATYDSRGNLTAWNGSTYSYDPFDLMWRNSNPVSSEEWIFLYTADDERVWTYKTNNTSTWTLRGPGTEVLREYADNGFTWTINTDYVYRNGLLLAAETPQGTRHLHLDHLGTPRLVSNSLGQQQAYHVYYPYGEEATAFNQDTLRNKFTGHERDFAGAAGTSDDLDYMHARHYGPMLARFLAADRGEPKLLVPQTWNRFSYVAGNPLKFIDPTGLDMTCGDPQDPSTCTYTDSADVVGDAIRASGIFGNVADSPLRPIPNTLERLERLRENRLLDKELWKESICGSRAVGVSFDVATINPFTSSGGGLDGINLEYVPGHGLGLYSYSTPDNVASFGLLLGVGMSYNVAWGAGAWSGYFDNVVGAAGPIGLSAFASPGSTPHNGWRGFGVGAGPGVGVGVARTDYKPLLDLSFLTAFCN